MGVIIGHAAFLVFFLTGAGGGHLFGVGCLKSTFWGWGGGGWAALI